MRVPRRTCFGLAFVVFMWTATAGRAGPAENGQPCQSDGSTAAARIAERHRVEVDPTGPLPDDVDGLKALLTAMRRGDQEIRALVVRSLERCRPRDDEAIGPVFKAGRAIDERNREVLQRILREKGWPVISVFGSEADQSAFLVAQHADRDRPLQKKVLKILAGKYRTGETSGENYALLFDRVRLGDGKRQRYGSQGRCKGNDWVPDPLEDRRRVDALRKEVGLEPMGAYRRRAATFVCGAAA